MMILKVSIRIQALKLLWMLFLLQQLVKMATILGKTFFSCTFSHSHRRFSGLRLRRICVSVVRTIPRQETAEVTVNIIVKSPYIVKACKDVIQSWPGVSWNADPLTVNIYPSITNQLLQLTFLTFYR